MKKLLWLALGALLASCGTAKSSGEAVKRAGPFTDKRGVSYSFEQDKTYSQDMALLTPAVKWFYNWYIQPHPEVEKARKERNVAFYPMVWNHWGDQKSFEAMLGAYLAENPGIDFLMGYNEPNLTDQCNYTPRLAAKYWPSLVKFAKKHNLKVIAPAMNYGTMENYWVPWVWLDEFFGIDRVDEETGRLVKNRGYSGVSLNDIDVIAVHSYMPDAGALKWFISQFKKYGKPIWLTEFCSWEFSQPNAAWQNAEYQMMFMSEAVTYLELDPDVEKYAWFIPKGSEPETDIPGNKLLTKTVAPDMKPPELTPLGIVYVNMGTCDKSAWIPAGQRIIAAHFSDMIFSDYIFKYDDPNWPRKEQGFTKNAGVHFRPGTDPGGAPLDMFDFSIMKWVEYQIEAPQSKTYTLSLRNTAEEATQIEITVDGEATATLALSPSAAWRTSAVPLQLAAGRHTVRLKVTSGDCALNWLIVQ